MQGGGRAAALSSLAVKVLATFSLVATQRGNRGTNIEECCVMFYEHNVHTTSARRVDEVMIK